MDTQWPRYEVFKQDTADKPHQAVGSVHAPDLQMALLMARDVFVRRPRCHSLWVAPAEVILSMTQEELALREGMDEVDSAESPPHTYQVFRKTTQRRAMTFVDHVGSVQAGSPAQALRQAIAQFSDGAAWVWWIVPEAAIARSQAEDVSCWFEPADSKTYRHQSAYGTVLPRRAAPAPPGDASAPDTATLTEPSP